MKLRADDITWQEIDGDLVILDLRSSTYLTTNASGAILMKQLTEARTTAELVANLVETFGITPEQAAADVRAFLSALGENGLLEESDRG